VRLNRPEQVFLVLAGGAAVAGAAGLMLGLWWAVAGVLAGPCIALIAAAIVETLTTPDPGLMPAHQHREALRLMDRSMASNRVLARIWPGQFQDVLAERLLSRSLALCSAMRYGEAMAAAEEGVEIYRNLAAANPAKTAPGLALALNNFTYPLRAAGRVEEALTAAREAVRINRELTAGRPRRYQQSLACTLGTQAELLSLARRPGEAVVLASEAASLCQAVRPGTAASSEAAEILVVYGQILCDLGRPREAARPLARAWHLVGGEKRNPRFGEPALTTAYDADPATFTRAWQAENAEVPPGWLTGLRSEAPGCQ
jgi:tetratricopeptide (TPR) repeat protein